MLPILIIRRCERGKGVYTVAGGDVEKQVVREILGLDEALYQHGDLTVYRIQIQKLISTLGSLIVIGFEASPDKYENYGY